MCRRDAARSLAAASVIVAAWAAYAQPVALDWRHIGNSAVELALPSVATGPVNRVWYSEDGSTLYARTASGRIFSTEDMERWQRVQDPSVIPPPEENPAAVTVPERLVKLASNATASGRLYGVGNFAYRSDDGGVSWSNLTGYRGNSILGDGQLSSVAVSPRDPDEVTIASQNGIWRSLDGGTSWTGLNQSLPNLPSRHIMGLPNGLRGVRLSLSNAAMEIEWAPGEKTAWQRIDATDLKVEYATKAALAQQLGMAVTAIATAKEYIYAGDNQGRLVASADAGKSWPGQSKFADLGRVESIWLDPNDPRVAVAAIGERPANSQNQNRPTYVLRTMNGGAWWEDITQNLPDNAAARGVTADRASGAIYVATDAGVFYTTTDLGAAGRPTSWTSLNENLPAAAATDVKLDSGGNQLYVALDGYGVYATIAPHRFRLARVVSAADYAERAAAPGALLSVIGARVESARTSNTVVPVLDSSDKASQIQVPFDVKGDTLPLTFQAAAGPFSIGLQLQKVSPAIFVDPDGTPLILDSDGVLLDATRPAHANGRIQVLATGFGRVTPDWPAGTAAPLTNSPHVAATVRAYLDRIPVEVTQAILAPGYVGFYLIEVQLPRVVNAGTAELVLEAEGQQSNHVRLYLQP